MANVKVDRGNREVFDAMVARAIENTKARQAAMAQRIKRAHGSKFSVFQPVLRDNTALVQEKRRLIVFDFRRQEVLVLQAHPLLAWKRSAEAGWRGTRPRVTLQELTKLSVSALACAHLPCLPEPDFEPDSDTGRYSPKDWGRLRDIRRVNVARKFAEWLDVPVRRVGAQFPIRSFQWNVLQLASRVPASIGLLESNPALGFLVATNWVFRGRSYRSGRPLDWARRYIGRKRRYIASRLGFPDSQAVVKVLAHVLPSACDPYLLLGLRPAMADPERMKVLAHLPAINKDVVRLMGTDEFWEHVSPRLLLEACDETACEDAGVRFSLVKTPVSYMVREVLQIMGAAGVNVDAVQFQSLSHLHRAYERWHGVFDRHRGAGHQLRLIEREAKSISLPPPPLPGNELIVPLCSGEALVAEGREMQHCVASYALKVAKLDGSYYIYRLLPPLDRGTVAIVLTANGWEIEQIYGIKNSPVSYQTRQYVASWLSGLLAPGELPGDIEPVAGIYGG